MKRKKFNKLLEQYKIFVKRQTFGRLGKGSACLDAGYVYAPYIPMIVTPIIKEEELDK